MDLYIIKTVLAYYNMLDVVTLTTSVPISYQVTIISLKHKVIISQTSVIKDGREQACIQAMRIYDFDSKTMPTTTVEGAEAMTLCEEKRLVHKLRILKRLVPAQEVCLKSSSLDET